MAQISQFFSNVGVFNPVATTANYVASLNDANGNVTIGISGTTNIGNVVITTVTNATSNTTGALHVDGGASLANGNIVVGGTVRSFGGPAISASYSGANANNQLQMSPGDIIYAPQDQNNTGNFANVAFGATITVTNGIPLIRSGQGAARVPDGVYRFLGKFTAGSGDGAGLFRRIS